MDSRPLPILAQDNETYAQWYGHTHSARNSKRGGYGLTEINRQEIGRALGGRAWLLSHSLPVAVPGVKGALIDADDTSLTQSVVLLAPVGRLRKDPSLPRQRRASMPMGWPSTGIPQRSSRASQPQPGARSSSTSLLI